MALVAADAFTATYWKVPSAQLTYWAGPQRKFRDEPDQIRDEADRSKIRRAYPVRGAVHCFPMTNIGDFHDPQTIG
jgi:hypothetical protein